MDCSADAYPLTMGYLTPGVYAYRVWRLPRIENKDSEHVDIQPVSTTFPSRIQPSSDLGSTVAPSQKGLKSIGALPYMDRVRFLTNLLSRVRWVALLALAVGMNGCAEIRGGSAVASGSEAPTSARNASSRNLKIQLEALAPTVIEHEAQRAADRAYEYSRSLAREYRAVRPAALHNFLVNIGLRKRGLCYHWAEDLLAELQTLGLTTLELHWGIARAGTIREHNSVVVTAQGQPFENGIVLDAWRRSGHLVWKEVSTDKYPWVEDVSMAQPASPQPISGELLLLRTTLE